MSGRGQLPTVTVVIPAYRRQDRLRACLEAVTTQDYPADRYDVVVVDDGSPTALAPAAADLSTAVRVDIHRQPNAGPAAARNTGARRATGDLIAFTDDDCTPEPGWVRALAEAHRSDPQALIGGPVVNALVGNPFAQASQELISYLAAHHTDGGRHRFFPSNNLAAPRDAFSSLGGFDESFPLPAGEDRELSERWVRSGRRLVAAPAAIVRHEHRMGFRDFWRQHRNYGRGAWQVSRRRMEQAGEGLRPEGPAFYLRMLAFPFGRWPSARAGAVAALLVVSQIANVVGFARAWREERRSARSRGRPRQESNLRHTD